MAIPKIKINKKILIIIGIILFVFVGLFLYMYFLIASFKATPPVYIQPTFTANLITQGISLYNNGNNWVPYSIISYNTINVSYIYFNTTLFKSKPPTSIFVLNPASGCFKCGNYQQTITTFFNDMIAFGIPNSRNATVISNPNNIPNNSILVILSGYMPSYLFNKYKNTNRTILDNLLDRGTSIIYTGLNFSYMLSGPTIVPNNNTPSYLNTIQNPEVSNTIGFNLKNSTFKFINGTMYGPFTFTHVYNGSITALPNILNEWESPRDSGYDLARSVSQLFWFPQYSHSSFNVTPKQNKSYTLMQLKNPLIYVFNNSHGKSTTIKSMNKGYLRTLITTSRNYTLKKNSIYDYIYYKPDYPTTGKFYINSKIIPGIPINVKFTVSLSNYTTTLQPHISIYNNTMDNTLNIPLSSIPNVKNNYTFVVPLNLNIPPGNYIAELKSRNNITYAEAVFYISPLNITLISSNLTLGIINFSIMTGNTSISNVNYTLTLNGNYKQKGTITDGAVTYKLPKGSLIPSGILRFKFNMLSSNFEVVLYHNTAGPFSNKQIILLGVVGIVVLALVTLVKAPLRDDFYIDVPQLPPHKTTNIRLKKESVVSTFNKLNSYYHWKHMPLSVVEARAAISNYIRYKNMPVNLTLNNVDMLLTELVGNGDLVSADGLYIPKKWIEETGHGIGYLATFKKLRMFMVTHALLFTDLDASPEADMVVSVHGEKHLIIIYSKTSKFNEIPVRKNARTFLVFLNRLEMFDFSEMLRNSVSKGAEEFRIYKSTGYIKLVDADNPKILVQ